MISGDFTKMQFQMISKQMTKKLFTERQTAIAAALAGPVPAGILIFLNYKTLNKEKQALVALAATLLFTILLFYTIFALPDEIVDSVPNFLFTAIYGLLVLIFYRSALAADIRQAFEQGAEVKSNWQVFGITVLGLAVSIAIMLGLAFDQPYYEGEVTNIQGNELYYDAEIAKINVNKLTQKLQEVDYFGPEYGNVARLELIAGEYFITLVIDETLWSDDEVMDFVSNLKLTIESEFGKKTHLKLESVTLAGESKFKYIDQP